MRSCQFKRSPPLKVQRLRTPQLRGAPLRAPVPTGAGTSEQNFLAAGRGPARKWSIGVEKRRIRCKRCAIPVAVLTPRAYLCSLSTSASLTHPRKHSVPSRLALSQRNRRHRVRHLADPDNGQILIAWCWQTDLFSDVDQSSVLCRNIHLSRQNIQAIFARNVLAQESAETPYVASAKTLGNGPSRTSRPPSGHQT